MKKESCETCWFYRARFEGANDFKMCLRYPAERSTNAGWWCGEYESAGSPESNDDVTECGRDIYGDT